MNGLPSLRVDVTSSIHIFVHVFNRKNCGLLKSVLTFFLTYLFSTIFNIIIDII